MKTVAKILLYNPHGQILFLRRSATHPRYPEHLDLPGGELDDTESPIDAVIREVLEETSLQISPQTIQKAFEKQHNTHTKHLLYKGQLTTPTNIQLSWEHAEYLWLTPQQLAKTPTPPQPDPYYKNVIQHGLTIP